MGRSQLCSQSALSFSWRRRDWGVSYFPGPVWPTPRLLRKPLPEALVGEVGSLNVDSFLLTQNGTGDEFIVFLNDLDASTGLTTHGSGGREQFREGAQVAVLIDDEGTAVQIKVKPSRPTIQPFSGAVTTIESGTMTVVRPSGESMTVQIPSGERAPQAGAVVMGFARASDNPGAPPLSTGLTTANQMRSRLEGFLDEANSAASHRPEQAGPNRQERSARLGGDTVQPHLPSGRHPASGTGPGQSAPEGEGRHHEGPFFGPSRLATGPGGGGSGQCCLRDMGVRGEPEDAPGRGSAQLNDGS